MTLTPLAREVQHLLAQRAERQRLGVLLAERIVNGGVPAVATSCSWTRHELPVLVRASSARRSSVRPREAGLALDRAHDDLVGVLREHLGR